MTMIITVTLHISPDLGLAPSKYKEFWSFTLCIWEPASYWAVPAVR